MDRTHRLLEIIATFPKARELDRNMHRWQPQIVIRAYEKCQIAAMFVPLGARQLLLRRRLSPRLLSNCLTGNVRMLADEANIFLPPETLLYPCLVRPTSIVIKINNPNVYE